MDKDKTGRKKSTERFPHAALDAYESLPEPPPDPRTRNELPDAFRRIAGFQERQDEYVRSLQSTIAADMLADGGDAAGQLSAECDEYMKPLLARTGPSISAALVTEGAIDQLDKLHGILEQLLDMQAQNYRLRRSTRDVETLLALKQSQMRRSDEILLENSDVKDDDDELEMEYNDALLKTILAAGNSATTKRSCAKKQRMRSKSVINAPNERALGHLQHQLPGRHQPSHHQSQYPLRRQSAITDIKAKVSKWTKVKAAFKWERANPSLNTAAAAGSGAASMAATENGRSIDSGIALMPLNNEVARYLRVPSLPVACGGGASSADSMLSGSASSGHLLLSGGGSSNPATPGTMSSASSIEDVRCVADEFRLARDSSKSDSRSESRGLDDDARRSRSLDGESTLMTTALSRQLEKHGKKPTPWRKVKDIIQTHRGSLRSKSRSRSVKSSGSVGCSRDVSPCDSVGGYVFATVPKSGQSSADSTVTTTPTTTSPHPPPPPSPCTNCNNNLHQQQHIESCPFPSGTTTSNRKTYPTLMLTAPTTTNTATAPTSHPAPGSVGSSPGSPYSPLAGGGSGNNSSFEMPPSPASAKAPTSAGRGSTRKSKLISDIECVPEGQPLDLRSLPRGRPPPSPLNLNSRQISHPDSSDCEQQFDHRASPLSGRRQFTWSTSLSRSRKSMLSGRNASAPNSPSQQFEFFGGEFESEELSSGDFSEPCTPLKKISPKTSLVHQQDEINRKYHELQQQISLEFQMKQREWERIRNLSIAAGSSPYSTQCDDYSSGKELSKSPSTPSKPIEENLTADFKKKLQEWRIKKQQSHSNTIGKDMQSSASPTKEAEKKIDWHLWKTGQIKLEGQGLKPMPDEKDLPEEFQRKLDEWKRIKSSGGSADANSSKRLSLKGCAVYKSEFGSSKKLKTSSDDLAKSSGAGEREKLFRLKSIAEPKPAKEVVVQTTKGAMKFEGISRKFTQKLYEWEKARGIGPESSTFALLHPGYRPLVVGSGELEATEKKPNSSPMGRSMSMDSMSPHASVPSIAVSHQPSSLSLNNVDDIVDTNSLTGSRQGMAGAPFLFDSSNSDLDLDGDDDDEDEARRKRQEEEDEEPEAVIVEVEDDYVETADSLFTVTPMIEKQTPIYRYEQTRKEYYAGNKEAVFVGESKPTIAHATSKALKDATRMVTSFREVRHGFKENVEHVQRVLKSLIDTVPSLKTSLQDNSDRLRESVDVIQNLAKNVIDKLTELEATASSKEDLEAKMTAIDGQLNILRKALNFVCKHTASRKTSRNEDVPAISITCEDAQPPPPERNVAVVSLAPIVFQGQVVINQVQVLDDRQIRHHLPPPPSQAAHSSEQELSEDVCRNSDCDSGNKNTTTDTTASSAPAQPSELETDTGQRTAAVALPTASVSRNSSNGAGTKRKVKLRRMGSRQNSKTESDSDEEAPNVVLDAPGRRLKRKTSRAKRLTESTSLDKADECGSPAPQPEDVVFTLRLKPGQPIEQRTEHSFDDAEATLPTAFIEPDPLEVLENLPGDGEEFIVSSNVFVKTKRRIYTPIADHPGAVIGKDIDTTSSASDRAVDSDLYAYTSDLPPLPQSPGQHRRHAPSGTSTNGAGFSKEPSPAIRLMIAKYNQRLSADRRNSSPLNSSGSASPIAWRSPVLERRTRDGSPSNGAICKSLSAGNMSGRQLKLCEVTQIHSSDAAVSQLVKGVLKSSSAGILTDTWTPLSVAEYGEQLRHIESGDVPLKHTLACDSMRKITASRLDVPLRAMTSDERAIGRFRKNSGGSIESAYSVIQRKIRPHRVEANPPAEVICPQDPQTPISAISNTLPRITRKYDASKPPSPRLAQRRPVKLSLDLNLRSPKTSAASGHLSPLSAAGSDATISSAAAAALTERAMKLKRAKEDFLKMSAGYRSAVQHLETEVIWRKNRNFDDDDEDDEDEDDARSGLYATIAPDASDMCITKSASVGMISEKCSARRRISEAAATNAECSRTSAGLTLPRNATRTSKSQGAIVEGQSAAATGGGDRCPASGELRSPNGGGSKFGFSTLAQKLRRVKLRRNSKELPAPGQRMNTVTKLCRQSLMVDIPGQRAAAEAAPDADGGAAEKGATSVRKSGSAQTMGGLGGLLFRRQERAEKLKKSRSIGQLDADR